MSSLEESDKEAAAVAVAPRVSLADIEASIEREIYFTGGDVARMYDAATAGDQRPVHPASLECLTICIVVMKNGYTVIGKSAPASPENFNVALGQKFAREDCVRQLWPLLGFALRQQRHAEGK